MLLLLLALLLPPGAPEGETRGGWEAQPHVALAETWPGAPGGPLIPEKFELPAASSGCGHVPATLSAPNASQQDRSHQQRHVPPKSHRPAGTHGLDARVKDLLRQVDPVTDTTKAPQGLWAALLRLVQLAGGLRKCRREDRYKRFLKQHVDESSNWDPTDPEYCNKMMKGPNINNGKKPCGWEGPTCKPINTFIHDSAKPIQAVCQREGGKNLVKNYHLSKRSFDLTVCRRECLSAKSHCEYEGQNIRAWIVLACEDKKPVHFECQIKDEPIALGQSQP